MARCAARPASKRQKTSSAAQSATSAEQHVPGTGCFITYKHTMNEVLIDENAVLLDLRLALYDAVTHNPHVICVCSPHMGANDTRTAALMGCLVDELESLQEKGKARRIVQQYFVAGVIHFDFIRTFAGE